MPEQPEIDVAHVARLARIELSEAETAAFQGEIASIVEYVRMLEEVDVAEVEPTAHATRIANVWRDDEPGACIPQEAALANAPAIVDDNLIQVPVVIAENAGGA